MPKLKSATLYDLNKSHVIIEVEIFEGFLNKLKTIRMHKEIVSNNTFGWKRFDDGYVSYDNCYSLNAFISTGKPYMDFLIDN